MRQNGVRMVMLQGADPKATARITAAMAQQGFKPDVVFSGAQAYDPATISLGGATVEGLVILQTLSLFAGEDSSIGEIALMNQWVQKVKPGFKSDLFTMYGWAEGRLLFQAMQAAGADLTRANVSAQLRKIHQFDGNGLLAPADPAGKVPATCFLAATIKGGKFTRVAPASGYICDKGGYYKP
jgi:ABC-type branched-subunit amino acid transport system substrate-binding protein